MVFGLNDDKQSKSSKADDQDDAAASAQAVLDEINAKEKSDSEDCAFC